jgi:hypothetical protein
MKHLIVVILIATTSCSSPYFGPIPQSSPSLTILDVHSHQQQTDYTCGPAAALSLLNYYNINSAEQKLSEWMRTDSLVGTTPEGLVDGLVKAGLPAKWGLNGSLSHLRENLSNGIPTLVEWTDWGGHWALVVGYDDRATSEISDDVIIFADPYDYHDDIQDGFTIFNAERFDYMWYDELLFDSLMLRVYVEPLEPRTEPVP